MSNAPGSLRLVSTVSVKADGVELADAVMASLVESRVSQSVGAASRLELRFNDGHFTIIDGSTFALGTEISVEHSTGSGSSVAVFAGEVTSIGIEQTGDTLHQLVVEALDRSHRLTRMSQVRTYLKMKYSDIVSKIAMEAGLSADVTATTATLEYVMQQGTDWDMLDEIALRTGMEWFVDDRTLVFRERPAAAGPTTTFGEDLRKFRARYSGGSGIDKVTVRGWDPSTKKAVVGTDTNGATNPSNANKPDGASALRNSPKQGFGAGTLTTAARVVVTQAEATLLAKAIAERHASHDLSARGEMFGNPAVKAGGRLTVKGVGTKMSGDYYLTSVEHVFGHNDMFTRFIAGGPAGESIVDLVGGQSSAAAGWSVNGLVIGIVTNINDPAGLNRVKVKYPALDDDNESDWARIASPMSGNNSGWSTMPSLNDEVLVGFEQGDFRRAYVLGSLWNGKDAPPKTVNGGKIDDHMFRSVKGHVMSFTEKDGSEAVALIHKNTKSTLVLQDKKVQLLVGPNDMIEIKSGSATIVINQGDIKIQGKAVEIKADTDLKLSGLNVEIKAQAGLKLESGAMADLKGSVVNVQSSGPLALKGTPTAIN